MKKLIQILVLSMTVTSSFAESVPSKNETISYIVNKMQHCIDHGYLPASVRTENDNLLLNYGPGGSYVIPMSHIEKASVNAEDAALWVSMDGNVVDLHLENQTIQSSYFLCEYDRGQRMDFQMKKDLANAFNRLHDNYRK